MSNHFTRYHVPQHLSEHIDYITPGVKLYAGARAERKAERNSLTKRGFSLPPLMSPLPSGVNVDASAPTNINQCDRIVEPQCIRALYNITIPTTAAKDNELGIFEDLGDIYGTLSTIRLFFQYFADIQIDQADLNLLFTTLTNITKGTHPVLKAIDGAVAPTAESNAGGESLLDLSISMPLIYPQKVWLYQTDDTPYENNYNYSGFLNNFFGKLSFGPMSTSTKLIRNRRH